MANDKPTQPIIIRPIEPRKAELSSPPGAAPIIRSIQVPDSELDFSFARSSGPGGQNVNKVNSKAVLRWNAVESPSIPDSVRQHVLLKLASQLNQEGELVISSDRFRDQIRNREDCLEKLRNLLAQAVERPRPRKKTKPSKSSQRRIKETKSRNSEKKSLRRSPRAHRYED